MSNQFSEIRIRKHFLPLESIEENEKEIIVIDLFKKESIIKNYVKMLQCEAWKNFPVTVSS